MPAEATVLRFVARRHLVRGVIWGAAFSAVADASLIGFQSAYPTVPERTRLAQTLGLNPGLKALFGVPRSIDTAGGFTAWRSLGVLVIVGALWGMLAATAALRGEEEAGRWELFVAGPMSRLGASAAALGGLAISFVVAWALLVACVVPAGMAVHLSVTSCVFFATVMLAAPVFFAATGAVSSQLAPTRRRAASIAGVVFGLAFVVRIVSDSAATWSWLRWVSPLGWINATHPFTGSDLAPLGLAAGATVALTAAALAVCARRDVGASALPDAATAPPRLSLLRSPLTLAVRLTWPTAVAWLIAGAGLGFLFGIVAKAAAQAMAASPSINDVLGNLIAGALGARAYLAVAFLIGGAVVAVAAAAQSVAIREEEAEGRLDYLLVRPVARLAWLGGRIAVSALTVAAVAVTAGLATWAGAALTDARVSGWSLVSAGLNTVPAALVVLAAGVLAVGVRPRAVSGVSYGVVAWSFLVELVGSILKAPRWLLDLSLFHHVALSPAVSPRWGTGAVLLGLAVTVGAVGLLTFSRRDLAGA